MSMTVIGNYEFDERNAVATPGSGGNESADPTLTDGRRAPQAAGSAR